MNFCNNCGNGLVYQARFCSSCGAATGIADRGAATRIADRRAGSATQATYTIPAAGKGYWASRPWWEWVLAALVVLAAAGILWPHPTLSPNGGTDTFGACQETRIGNQFYYQRDGHFVSGMGDC